MIQCPKCRMITGQIQLEIGVVKRVSNSLHYAMKSMRKVDYWREELEKTKDQLNRSKAGLAEHQSTCDYLMRR